MRRWVWLVWRMLLIGHFIGLAGIVSIVLGITNGDAVMTCLGGLMCSHASNAMRLHELEVHGTCVASCAFCKGVRDA